MKIVLPHLDFLLSNNCYHKRNQNETYYNRLIPTYTIIVKVLFISNNFLTYQVTKPGDFQNCWED